MQYPASVDFQMIEGSGEKNALNLFFFMPRNVANMDPRHLSVDSHTSGKGERIKRGAGEVNTVI